MALGTVEAAVAAARQDLLWRMGVWWSGKLLAGQLLEWMCWLVAWQGGKRGLADVARAAAPGTLYEVLLPPPPLCIVQHQRAQDAAAAGGAGGG